jgi:hypothetical protein
VEELVEPQLVDLVEITMNRSSSCSSVRGRSARTSSSARYEEYVSAAR